jgi:hypothetical protein
MADRRIDLYPSNGEGRVLSNIRDTRTSNSYLPTPHNGVRIESSTAPTLEGVP